MTPEQENALVAQAVKGMDGYGFFPHGEYWQEPIRLAIRAAVAQERERAAKVCEEHEPKDYTMAGIMTRMICAAAIRRGDD